MEPASKISMSQEIIIEAQFMLQALFLGMILFLLYDFLIIARRVVKHGKLSMGVEDMLYWIANTFLIFKLLFKYNFGIIRWFVILGVGLGMLICKLALGEWFVRIMSEKIGDFLKFVKKVIISMKNKANKYVKILEKKSDK